MVVRPQVRRDALGRFFFLVHVAILAAVLLGWALPGRRWLAAYLIFLPVLVLHWQVNAGQCALNNLESWIRYGAWRAPDRNPEEGAWLRTLLARLTGVMTSRAQMDVMVHAVLALLWLAALARLLA